MLTNISSSGLDIYTCVIRRCTSCVVLTCHPTCQVFHVNGHIMVHCGHCGSIYRSGSCCVFPGTHTLKQNCVRLFLQVVTIPPELSHLPSPIDRFAFNTHETHEKFMFLMYLQSNDHSRKINKRVQSLKQSQSLAYYFTKLNVPK